MLKSVIILLCVFGYAVAQQTGPPVQAPHDGQPGCAIRYEFTKLWRDNFENSRYWECKSWRVPATQRHCAPGTSFQDSWQTCVPFNVWEWTPYSEPPTRPGCGEVDECDEIITEPTTPECPWTCPTSPTTTPIFTTPTWITPNYTDTTPSTNWTDTTPSTNWTDTTPSTNWTDTTPSTNWTDTTPSTNWTDTTPSTNWTDTTPSINVTDSTSPITESTTPNWSIPTEETEPVGTCPGATDEQHNPGTMSCFRPDCTSSEWQIGTLYPTRDPTQFYQCHSPEILSIMPCGALTCFSFSEQVCVHVRNWKNDCA